MGQYFKNMPRWMNHPSVRRLAGELGWVALAVVASELAKKLREWANARQAAED